MIEHWIFWLLLAEMMQAIRTAAQKRLDISPLGATFVRYLFGLPFALTRSGRFSDLWHSDRVNA